MTKGENNLAAAMATIIKPALMLPEHYVAKVESRGNFYSATLSVHPADMPRIIGKAGNNVRAIKCILAHIGQMQRCFIRFYVAEPADAATPEPMPQPFQWDPKPLIKAAQTALDLAGYDDRLTGPVPMSGKQFFTAAGLLDPSFAEALARWMHMIGRAYGENVILIYDRAAPVR